MSDDKNILKFVFLGPDCEKTKIMKKYFQRRFHEKENIILPSFQEKVVDYQGKKMNLSFFDTAGQIQFRSISRVYYQNAIGALAVYNLTNFETFEKLKSLIKDFQEVAGKEVTVVIAGNNFELSSKAEIDEMRPLIESYCSKEGFCMGGNERFTYISG